MDSGGSSVTVLPPIGGALQATGATGALARPTSEPQEEAESTEAALRLLRERLPPLRPPSPIKRVFRPAPPTLNYAAPRSRSSATATAPKLVDLDKESKLVEKSQTQRRSMVEAEAQKAWTHILVQHLHRLAELEDSVPYREASMREALLREEEREYMILAVEHETRTRRIRGRDLVGIQLKKHLLAIEQEDARRVIAAEQTKDIQSILRREAVYRPAMPEERSPHRVARAMVGSKSKPLSSAASRDTLPGGHSGGDNSVRRPRPPQPRVNSARGEDQFVSNGRLMWGQQKLQQINLRAIDAAVAALPATEQLRREEAEGQELDARLHLERRFADASHDMRHLNRARKLQEEEEARVQLLAHDKAASAAVHLVLDHVMATVGGRLDEVQPSPSAAVSLAATKEAMTAAPLETAEGPPTRERRSSKTRSSSIVGIASDASGASAETSFGAVPRRRDSIVKRVEAPSTKVDEQRLIAAAVATLDAGTPRLRTALELLAMVDEQNQALFPCPDEETWKFSGIAALRLAQLPNQTVNDSAAVAETQPLSDAAQSIPPPPPPQQHLPSPDSSPEVLQRQQQLSPPATRPLFASFDLLCGVMIRDERFEDTYPSLRECARAAVQMENEAFGGGSGHAVSESRDLRRLSAGHRDAQLNRDYLEHVLWRTTLHIKGIVNAIELIPTRWSAYKTSAEMEDEECLVVSYSETLAREKIIREQIDEFLGVLRYIDKKRSKVIQR